MLIIKIYALIHLNIHPLTKLAIDNANIFPPKINPPKANTKKLF